MPMLALQVDRRLEELQEARRESDRLFAIIRPDSIFERPIDARHRVIFYVGHLEGFDSIQICREGLGVTSPDPVLDELFQAGIDPDSSNLPADRPDDWPSLAEVQAYVQRCRQHVDQYLERAPEEVICMAIEHRWMHLETLAYMFHNFGYDWKVEPAALRSLPSTVSDLVVNQWCDIPAGTAILGKADDDTFGWDNEFQQHFVEVPTFRVDKYPVTNGAYLDFVQQTGAPLPQFWSQRGAAISQRGMLQELPLPLDWPVYVTLDQARAYAAWAGKSILSEAQFHRAAYANSSSGKMRPYPWGNAQPSQEHGNFDFKSWDPEAVTATPGGASFFGVEQLVGNGWEWTDTSFGPFTGFKPRPSYPGYSANFFDGEHFVLKGGSPRTASRLLRASFRNWFRHDYPYMYAKFRLVQNS